MKKKIFLVCLLLFVLIVSSLIPTYSKATQNQLRIAIMQDEPGAAGKYQALVHYMSAKGIEVHLISAANFLQAARMFEAGSVDAMFSGSGVAGIMIMKDLAVPLVRPVDKDGNSTYWAVILAPKGAAKYSGDVNYFRDKKVVFSGLASAGEFYFLSLPGADKLKNSVRTAASHGAAIIILEQGEADIAIVKNRVWDKSMDKYPNLEKVGEDKGENPDSTLIVSKKLSPDTTEMISTALLSIKADTTPHGEAVKRYLGTKGYIKTTVKDFDHTISLLKKAGVTESFKFSQ